jgi:hypothetical protein
MQRHPASVERDPEALRQLAMRIAERAQLAGRVSVDPEGYVTLTGEHRTYGAFTIELPRAEIRAPRPANGLALALSRRALGDGRNWQQAADDLWFPDEHSPSWMALSRAHRSALRTAITKGLGRIELVPRVGFVASFSSAAANANGRTPLAAIADPVRQMASAVGRLGRIALLLRGLRPDRGELVRRVAHSLDAEGWAALFDDDWECLDEAAWESFSRSIAREAELVRGEQRGHGEVGGNINGVSVRFTAAIEVEANASLDAGLMVRRRDPSQMNYGEILYNMAFTSSWDEVDCASVEIGRDLVCSQADHPSWLGLPAEARRMVEEGMNRDDVLALWIGRGAGTRACFKSKDGVRVAKRVADLRDPVRQIAGQMTLAAALVRSLSRDDE